MTKEALIRRDLVDIVSTCYKIASTSPRSKDENVSVSPLVKRARAFSRVLEVLEENDELSDLIKIATAYYRRWNLDAVALPEWLVNDTQGNDSNVTLVYGDADDREAIRLNLTPYARIAREAKDKTDYDTLEFHALRLLQRMATPTVAEQLDEKIVPLEKKLKRATPAAAGANNPFGNLQGMMSSLMGSIKPLLDQLNKSDDGSETPLSSMLKNPETSKMMEGIADMFPPQFREKLQPMISDLQQGKLDARKIVEQASVINDRLKDGSIPALSHEAAVQGSVPASGPMELLQTLQSDPSEGYVCDGDVCYAPTSEN